jgi:hypothetical protein
MDNLLRPVIYIMVNIIVAEQPSTHLNSGQTGTATDENPSFTSDTGTRYFEAEDTLMAYRGTKNRVSNRGRPPDSFLDELVSWGRTAPDDIFAPNPGHDIYTNVFATLGPWQGLRHRRAVMLEVMRVLAGFESSWNWNEGVDVTNAQSVTPATIEAGAWQVSADSMGFGPELKSLVLTAAGAVDGNTFQQVMKENHPLAMEYIARLLRRTVNHKLNAVAETSQRSCDRYTQQLTNRRGATICLTRSAEPTKLHLRSE